MPEGRRPRGATPCPKSRQQPRVPGCDGAGTAERSYPMSEVGAVAESARLRQRRRAERSYFTFKVRRGRGEEISLTHGKEQLPLEGIADSPSISHEVMGPDAMIFVF